MVKKGKKGRKKGHSRRLSSFHCLSTPFSIDHSSTYEIGSLVES